MYFSRCIIFMIGVWPVFGYIGTWFAGADLPEADIIELLRTPDEMPNNLYSCKWASLARTDFCEPLPFGWRLMSWSCPASCSCASAAVRISTAPAATDRIRSQERMKNLPGLRLQLRAHLASAPRRDGRAIRARSCDRIMMTARGRSVGAAHVHRTHREDANSANCAMEAMSDGMNGFRTAGWMCRDRRTEHTARRRHGDPWTSVATLP